MQSRTLVYFQRALRGRNPNALTSPVATVAEGRASAPKFESASARAVRPLAASARSQRLGTGSGLFAEPSFGIEEEASLPWHSFLIEPKNPAARVSLWQVTACSERTQALRGSEKPNTGGRAATSFARGGGLGLFAGGATQRRIRTGRAVRAALPNPSIERDVQELSLLAAPHVKR